MTEQLQLIPPPPPRDKDVAWLEDYLNEHPTWHTAEMIIQALTPDASAPARENRKRQLRQIAQASPWIISGQKGYKHLSRATPEEINHFVNWMESQAREMTRRAETVRRNAHRILG